MKLTTMEHKVLEAMFESAAGNGHDFGIMEEVISANVVEKNQLGAIVANLIKKGLITIWDPVCVDGEEMVSQFAWSATDPLQSSDMEEKIENLLMKTGDK